MIRPAAAAALVAVLAAATGACAPRRVKGPTPPGGRDLIVLLPDASGSVGRARVSNPAGSVDLDSAREATDVSADAPPDTPRAIDEVAVRRIFGDTLSTLPPPPVVFMLRFQFQSDELTAESRDLLARIVEAVSERPAPEVLVVGHTDTAGAAALNLKLGLKRATAIRALLVRAGLDASLIEVTSHGEQDPLVPTPDDTPEPRNRRVEIAVR